MRIVGFILVGLVLVFVGGYVFFSFVTNPRVEQELLANPDGERAKKVMLIKLPSGRQLPVNYWQGEGKVFAGADGRWWRELEGSGKPVEVWVRGEWIRGTARAVTDDPEYTKRVFADLRPTALPGFGTLVEVTPDAGAAGASE